MFKITLYIPDGFDTDIMTESVPRRGDDIMIKNRRYTVQAVQHTISTDNVNDIVVSLISNSTGI